MDFNTGSGPGGAGSPGGSSGGVGGGPPRGAMASGGEFDYRDPVQSYVRTVVSVVTRTTSFFAGIRRQGDFVNPLVFGAISALISAVLGGIVGIFIALATGDQGIGGAVGSLIVSIIFTPIFAVIGFFIFAGILHLLVMLLIKPNSGFEATFRVVAYSSVTQLVSWIPILGILLSLYGIYLGIVGVREVHATTTGRAALVVLIPAAVVILLFLLLAALIGAALFFGTQQ